MKASESGRPRVLVCGSKFGRVYMAALRAPDARFELVGLLARGSARSQACAQHFGVPLYQRVDQLPDAIDIACVVVGSGLLGGEGAVLSQALLERGTHVLQEHPLHQDELAACLRTARAHHAVYQLNPFYRYVEPVAQFIAAARALRERQRPLFVEAIGSVIVSYSLLDIIAQALGGLRPFAFDDTPARSSALERACHSRAPFRSLEGAIAGVPVHLRIQNQMHPHDPDSYTHLLHRITLGTEGGTLTLASTHGPLLWCPRPHMPRQAEDSIALDLADDAQLDFASAVTLGADRAPSYREVVGRLWPKAVERALVSLHDCVQGQNDPRHDAQYHLTLTSLWQSVTAKLGYPELLDDAPPCSLSESIVRDAITLGCVT